MLMVLCLLVIFLNVADNYTTFQFIDGVQGEYVVVEGNPIMRFLIDNLGLKTSLVFDMTCLAFLAIFVATTSRLSWNVRFWALVVLALLPLWAVVNNLHVALMLDLPIL